MTVNRETIVPLLRELAQLLERNGHPWQAEFVSALAVVAERDVTAVAPGLASGAMWGGSGSVFDVGEFRSRADRRRSLQLLVQLAEELRQAAIKAPGAYQKAEIMSNWLKSGIV